MAKLGLCWLRCPQDEEGFETIFRRLTTSSYIVDGVSCCSCYCCSCVGGMTTGAVPLNVLHVYVGHALAYQGVWGWCRYTKVVVLVIIIRCVPIRHSVMGGFFLGGGKEDWDM